MAKRNIAALAAGTVQSAGLENISRGAGLAGMLQFGGAVLPNARLLPLDRLDLNPYQARQHFDETALAELTDSVREYGVLEPILVRPVAGDRFEILAGERRYRAAVAAGRDTIDDRVGEGSDDLGEGRLGIRRGRRSSLDPGGEGLGLDDEGLLLGGGRARDLLAELVLGGAQVFVGLDRGAPGRVSGERGVDRFNRSAPILLRTLDQVGILSQQYRINHRASLQAPAGTPC